MCQNSNDAVFAHFDMTNFTVNQVSSNGNGSNASASITAVGNDWYRISLSGIVSTVSTNYYNQFYFEDAVSTGFSPNAYTGDGVSGFYLWGWQLEASSYPTSYINTTSASATRVADACFKTGISSLIGQTQGTLFVDVAEESPNEDGRYMFISDASFTNRIVIYQASGSINVYCSAGGGFNLTYSPPAGRLKIAFVYKSNDYALWVNGVVRTATVVSAVPSGLNAMGISSNEGSIGTPQPLDTSVNQAILFPTRLTNAELASLTTL
jgi:hypothetical protein